MVAVASRGLTFADLPLTAVLVKSDPAESSRVNHVERNGNE
jgi:hypothetical protein